MHFHLLHETKQKITENKLKKKKTDEHLCNPKTAKSLKYHNVIINTNGTKQRLC